MARGLVLLAEADDRAREKNTQRLQQAGYTVLAAKDGETIIRQLGSCQPKNVVLGHKLNGISPKETCRLIRKAFGTSIPIMFLAENPTLGDLHDVLDSGGNDYFVKNGSASVAGRVNDWQKHGWANGMEARRQNAVKTVARKIAEDESTADMALDEDILNAIVKESVEAPRAKAPEKPKAEAPKARTRAPAAKEKPDDDFPEMRTTDDDEREWLSSMAAETAPPDPDNRVDIDEGDVDAFFSSMDEEKPAAAPTAKPESSARPKATDRKPSLATDERKRHGGEQVWGGGGPPAKERVWGS